MKHLLAFLSLYFFAGSIFAQNYQSLDPQNPIQFSGNKIVYAGETIALNEHNLFLDGNLTAEQIKDKPFVFNNFEQTIRFLETVPDVLDVPKVLHIAPFVYWIDNPDYPEIRRAAPDADKIYGKSRPYGMTVNCENLHLRGLTENPENVVLASNRGQTQGADGNFTMFHFIGNDLKVSNLTMGNYCNVDLEYPLKPTLNRPKRAEAIVQAQLAICEGDRIWAENCRFISRLNLNPLSTWRRSFFHRCYFECTDDALAPTGVYLGCRFKFFSSKPFAQTRGAGAVLLDCDIDIAGARATQYLVKRNSPIALVDVRFHTDTVGAKNFSPANPPIYLGWVQDPDPEFIHYQYNVTLNGKPVLVESRAPETTVDMTGKKILNAYLVEYNGEKIYNTYNLLDGANDGFDPMNIWSKIEKAELAHSKNYSLVDCYLEIFRKNNDEILNENTIETGKDTISLIVFDVYSNIIWSADAASSDFVKMIPDENTCQIIPTNHTEETHEVIIYATTESGLRAAKKLLVKPPVLPAPKFIKKPEIKRIGNELILDYELDLQGHKDESVIEWFRTESPILKRRKRISYNEKNTLNEVLLTPNDNQYFVNCISISRNNQPQKIYKLTKADEGRFISFRMKTKSNRSECGDTLYYDIITIPKDKKSIFSENTSTDFHNFPVNCTSEIRKGFWTMDKYRPQEEFTEWKNDSVCPWAYGFGFDAAAQSEGLYQTARGARLLYTPMEDSYGDMHLSTTVNPCKGAGQGFGSATGQYLEIYIKYDTRTQTGYGLRTVRTTKHDRAVDFVLMKYDNGKATPITEPVTSTCYKGNCTVSLTVKGNRLTATATSDKSEDRVNLQAEIEKNDFGGIGFQHTGTGNTNATVIKSLAVDFGK